MIEYSKLNKYDSFVINRENNKLLSVNRKNCVFILSVFFACLVASLLFLTVLSEFLYFGASASAGTFSVLIFLSLFVILFLSYLLRSGIKKPAQNTSVNYESCLFLLEEERNRIARELHDGIQQKLAGITMLAHAKKTSEEDKSMDRIIELLKDSIQDIRNISHGMNYENFKNSSLCELIQNATSILSDHTSVKINAGCDMNRHWPAWYKINLFRITQELLTNTIKHAKANAITIHVLNKENEIVLVYQDNGTGIKNMREGMGLKNIRKRVEALNGRIKLSSSPGFTAEISIPAVF